MPTETVSQEPPPALGGENPQTSSSSTPIAQLSDSQLAVIKARECREQRKAAGFMSLLDPVSAIERKPLRWLWPWRVPLGKLTILAGDPGLGKSLLLLDLAARVSKGHLLPDGGSAESGDVIVVSAEDDPADTIRPRLEAAGADLARVHILRGCYQHTENGKLRIRDFSLADLEILTDALDAIAEQGRTVRLVVIDPISAYLGDLDGNDNGGIRGLLRPLAELAARRAVAIIGLSHLNKAAGMAAMHRVTGSLAFVAAARAVYLLVADQEQKARKLFLPLKCNLGPDVGGLAFRIESDGDGVPCLRWEAGAVDQQADALLAEPQGERQSEQQDAEAWLREVLSEGPVPAVELRRQAGESGVAWRTLARAKRAAGAVSLREGTTWVWKLQECQECQDSTPGTHGILGILDRENGR